MIIQKCVEVAKNHSDATASYGIGSLGCVSGIDIAQVIGGVILLSRLVVDVPTAYDYVKKRFFSKSKRKQRGKRKR